MQPGSTSGYSISTGTLSYEVRRLASHRDTQRQTVMTREFSGYQVPNDVPELKQFQGTVVPIMSEGTGIVPPANPVSQITGPGVSQAQQYIEDVTQPIPLNEFMKRYPGFNPRVYDAARRTELQFQPSLYLGEPGRPAGAQYNASANVMYFVNGQPLNSIAHEFVHFALARAPELLDPKTLTREQRLVHERAMRFMAAQTGSMQLESLLSGDISINLNWYPHPGQVANESIAHSLAGNFPANPFPASYFAPLFSDARTAERIQQSNDYFSYR